MIIVDTFVEAVGLHNSLIDVYIKHKYLVYKGLLISRSRDGSYILEYKLINANKDGITERGTENYRRSEFFKHPKGIFEKGEE